MFKNCFSASLSLRSNKLERLSLPNSAQSNIAMQGREASLTLVGSKLFLAQIASWLHFIRNRSCKIIEIIV